jgi:cell division protein FtsB
MKNLNELEVAMYLSADPKVIELYNHFEALLDERTLAIEALEKRIDKLEEERNDLFDEISDLSQELHEKQGIIEDLEFKAWRLEELEK